MLLLPIVLSFFWLGYNYSNPYGYGSIPINTIFRVIHIHKSQLFWCELQGYKVLTHSHINPILIHGASSNQCLLMKSIPSHCWLLNVAAGKVHCFRLRLNSAERYHSQRQQWWGATCFSLYKESDNKWIYCIYIYIYIIPYHIVLYIFYYIISYYIYVYNMHIYIYVYGCVCV